MAPAETWRRSYIFIVDQMMKKIKNINYDYSRYLVLVELNQLSKYLSTNALYILAPMGE